MNHGSALPRPDLTNDQVELLIETFETEATEAGELLDMLRTYAVAGGRDWETYERLLDRLARTGMRMVMAGRGASSPELPERAGALLAAERGRIPEFAGEFTTASAPQHCAQSGQ